MLMGRPGCFLGCRIRRRRRHRSQRSDTIATLQAVSSMDDGRYPGTMSRIGRLKTCQGVGGTWKESVCFQGTVRLGVPEKKAQEGPKVSCRLPAGWQSGDADLTSR